MTKMPNPELIALLDKRINEIMTEAFMEIPFGSSSCDDIDGLSSLINDEDA